MLVFIRHTCLLRLICYQLQKSGSCDALSVISQNLSLRNLLHYFSNIMFLHTPLVSFFYYKLPLLDPSPILVPLCGTLAPRAGNIDEWNTQGWKGFPSMQPQNKTGIVCLFFGMKGLMLCIKHCVWYYNLTHSLGSSVEFSTGFRVCCKISLLVLIKWQISSVHRW